MYHRCQRFFDDNNYSNNNQRGNKVVNEPKWDISQYQRFWRAKRHSNTQQLQYICIIAYDLRKEDEENEANIQINKPIDRRDVISEESFR